MNLNKLFKLNQLKIGAILSYVYIACNLVIHLVYTPVMIRLLGQSEYGLYTLVASVVSYLGLFSMGFTGAYLRFYSRYKVQNDNTGVARLNGMFLTIFLCMSIMAFVCGMVLAQFAPQVFGNNLTADELHIAKILMEILVVNVALTFPSSVFNSMISSHEQFLFQRLLLLASILFNPMLCLPLLIAGYGSISVVSITTAITVFKLLINIWFCIKKLKTPFIFGHFDFGLFKEISFFSFFLFLNMIIDQVNLSVDKFILGRVAGTVQVAVYGVATQFSSQFISIATAISSVFAPRVNRIIASGENGVDKKLSDLLVKVGRLQYMLSVYILVGFIFFGRQFVIWWAGAEYIDSYYVALFLLSPMILVLPHNLGLEIRRAKNKHQIASVIMMITTVFNLLISIQLAKKFGAAGAAFGTWMELLINTAMLDVYYVKIIGLDIRRLYVNFAKISLVCVVPALVGLPCFYMENIVVCIGWMIFYTVVFWMFMYRFAMNRDERELFDKPLRRVSKRNANK